MLFPFDQRWIISPNTRSEALDKRGYEIFFIVLSLSICIQLIILLEKQMRKKHICINIKIAISL
jgi:hypothetical protein